MSDIFPDTIGMGDNVFDFLYRYLPLCDRHHCFYRDPKLNFK